MDFFSNAGLSCKSYCVSCGKLTFKPNNHFPLLLYQIGNQDTALS